MLDKIALAFITAVGVAFIYVATKFTGVHGNCGDDDDRRGRHGSGANSTNTEHAQDYFDGSFYLGVKRADDTDIRAERDVEDDISAERAVGVRRRNRSKQVEKLPADTNIRAERDVEDDISAERAVDTDIRAERDVEDDISIEIAVSVRRKNRCKQVEKLPANARVKISAYV